MKESTLRENKTNCALLNALPQITNYDILEKCIIIINAVWLCVCVCVNVSLPVISVSARCGFCNEMQMGLANLLRQRKQSVTHSKYAHTRTINPRCES